MKTQMRLERLAPFAHREFFNFREKIGGHSRRGKKAKIAAARLRGLILRRFRGELRQRFPAREADGKRVDRFLFGFDNFSGRIRRSGGKKVRSAEPDRLRKGRAMRFKKIPAFLFRYGCLRGDLALEPLQRTKLIRDPIPQGLDGKTARTGFLKKGLVIPKLRAYQRQFPIEFHGICRLISRQASKTFPGNQVARRENPLLIQIPFVNPFAFRQGQKAAASKNTSRGVAKSGRAEKEFAAEQTKGGSGHQQANQAELAHYFSAISDR